MPRSIWSGAISFGLVNVPVKLYSAVSRKAVRFHQLHDESGVRIQQRRVDPSTGEEVSYEHIVKGYEIGPERYVVVTPDELEALDPKKTRSIDIEEFVDLDEIDPIFFDHPYYLAPAQGGAKAYKLLLDAMREARKVAIGKVVIRQKESLVALRPMEGDVFGMTTMVFADEVVDPAGLDELESLADVEAGERELAMAKQLIESLSADFEPEKYHDQYRERVLELIERKAAGEEIAVQPAEEPAPVPDLMAALEASIAAAKKDDDGTGKPARSKAPANGGRAKESGSDGKASSRSGGRKKAATKK
jgi:DNA end-binding protein Ku